MGRSENPRAKARWRLLSRSLLSVNKKKRSLGGAQDGGEADQDAGKKLRRRRRTCWDLAEGGAFRFPSFDVFRVNKVEACGDGSGGKDGKDWYMVTARCDPRVDLKVSVLRPALDINTLSGFNTTGNLCVWPSEECLAALLMADPSLCSGRDVVELGAGMTGLAGLAAAMVCGPRSLLLTDGNVDGVDNLRDIVERNGLGGSHAVSARELRWERVEQEEFHVRRAFLLSSCAVHRSNKLQWCRRRHLLFRTSGSASTWPSARTASSSTRPARTW